jgi:CDP-diacylglycerol--glycerol-3-phosphate 3-phosphatidyltransferase
MKENPWTLSNGLSALRIVLVLPITMLLLRGEPDRLLLLSLILLALLTDYLDGAFARRSARVTELGRIIDPLADKIGLGAIVIVLAVQGRLPVWFLIMAVGRDLIILIGGLYLKLKRGVVLESNATGKWTSGAIALYLMLAIFRLEGFALIEQATLAISACMIVISLLLYSRRAARFLSGAQATPAADGGS